MPSIGQLSLPIDQSLTVVGPNGPITFNRVTSFTSSQETKNLQSDGIDGTTLYDEIPKGWKGTFELERAGGQLDAYFAQAEARYFSGGGTYSASITENVQEPDGGTSQFRYDGVSLKLNNAGTWAGDAYVKQSVSFNASRRRKVI